MANVKLSAMSAALALAGDEIMAAVQGGGNVVISPNQIQTFLGIAVTSGKTFTVKNSLTLAGTDGKTMTFPTTSATMARTDAAQTFTGTQTFGAVVATTINGNTFTAGTATLTGAASKTLTFDNSLELAGTDGTTITFPSTSATMARTDAGQTFTGTQAFGAVTASTINGATLTASTGTITLTNAKTLAVQNSLTFKGTDATTMTFPATSATVARTDAAQTFTGTQTFSGAIIAGNLPSGDPKIAGALYVGAANAVFQSAG